ncbi:MAG: Mut7-C ubiquitin/RNAse domain-containing protein [Rhodocyclales bacterium]|nr:Mut7-C ubiquitin/RNAse domain-containing protein [Rhodocyclales bacterium]
MPRAQAMPPVVASFRFYAELNDFIAPERRHCVSAQSCAADATVKHAIEACGVPHTEVELILVNGEAVDFSYRLRDGDRVSVYPVFEAFDVTPLLRLRPRPLRETRFFADAHLGGLARLLRLAGFDTRYENGGDDGGIIRIALAEGRIVLSRDRELLMRRELTHGCYVHALQPDAQLAEVLARLDLLGSLRPFSRCLECNAPLAAIDKAAVSADLPPSVRERQQRFSRCAVCRRVYWEGSHWQHMQERLLRAVASARALRDHGGGAAPAAGPYSGPYSGA